MEKITDQELIDLLDNKFGTERAREIMNLINKDRELSRRFSILKSVHRHLDTITFETAPVDFSDQVMKNLHNPKYLTDSLASPYHSKNLFTILTIFAGILVGVYILASGIVTIPFFDQITLSPVNLKGNEIDVTPFIDSITSGVIFKVFLLTDMILAWFLLDRMVLRPYFESRRKKYAY